MSFGTAPPQWIKDHGLKTFTGVPGVLGRSIAALKCYITIAANHPLYDNGAVLSLFDIGKLANLSKPMVIEGVELLRAAELVEVHTRGVKNTNRYVLVGLDPATGFTKVPQDVVSENLRGIGNRGVAHLDALKIYLTLLFLRDNNTNKANVSHQTLVQYTGVRPDAVARGNSVLAALGLILIRQSETLWGTIGRPMNEYTLRGDFAGKFPRRLLPSERRVPPWAERPPRPQP